MTTFRSASVPTPHPSVGATAIGSEVVLYDTRTFLASELNPSASLVWLHLDGESSVERIAAKIGPMVGHDPATIEGDVLSAVEEFRSLGLLAEEPDASGGGGPGPPTAALPSRLLPPPET